MPTLVTRGAASVRGFGFAGTTPVLADPYFNYTTLLLHGNGTNGGQNNTFLDSGTANGGVGFDITRNGNTTQGTFSPFSQTGWSNYFNGGSDRISNASANVADFATNNFTVEMFVFLTSTADQMFFEGPSNNGFQFFIDAGVLKAGNAGTASAVTYTLPSGFANTWHHICVVREGTGSNQTSLYVDGVRQSQGTLSNNFTTTGFQISRTASFLVYGYISNLRVVKGTAVYTAAFTPPTAPLTAISGTSLLICQSNRFVDNSGSSVALTIAGNTSVQAFSPFAPTAAYSASTVGGSGYFDGTGDYLNTGSNTAFALGTGDFTWEAWLYRTVSATQEIYTSMTTDGLIIYISGNAAVVRRFGVADLLTSSASIALNTWTHIAVARSGTTLSMWINGSRSAGGTTTNSTNFAQSGLRIGINDVGSSAYTGYMSNLRVVKGTAVYDPTQTSITVPTAPLTNISNTSLLLNFTNAAIIDNTAKNVLETVADAQISTTQSKFGGASLAFDGSGDWLAGPPTPQTDLGSGDFTIEAWLYRTASGAASDSGIVSRGAPTTLNGFAFGYTSANVLVFNFNYSGAIVTGVTVIPANTWTHVAVSRNGNTFRLFVNGVLDATATSTNSQTTNAGDIFYVGRSGYDSGRIVTGYLDDVRITKGIARYTSNFTPQTSQWQDQ